MVVAAQGEEVVGEGQGPLQPGGRAPTILREKVQREEQAGGRGEDTWVVLVRLGGRGGGKGRGRLHRGK